jgi:PST family polysaccharide transporter
MNGNPASSGGKDDDPKNLGGLAARGAAVTLGGQALRIIIQLLGILVLARLLAPADYGLLAMVMALIGIGEVFRDFGLSSAAVQVKNLSRKQKDNLFWINAAIGVALGVIVFVLAPVVAEFYGEPRLVGLTQFLALTFVLNGLSTQFRAQLNRDLRFAALSIVDVTSAALALIVAIMLAQGGLGYWALGWQQVTSAFLAFVVLVVVARWMPRGIHRNVGMGGLLRYGGNLVGVQLLTYVSKNVDAVIVGNQLGASQLGLYNRASQILMLPLNQINAPTTKVALPILSRLQNDPIRFAAFVIRGQSVMVHVLCAIFAFAAAQAGPLILMILGPQWSATVPIFQILALGGVAQAVSYATYWVFLAKGLTGSNLRFSLASRPLLILAIFLGSFAGVEGVAAGYSLGLLLIWPLGLIWISRVSDAPAGGMFGNGLRAIAGYGACGVVAHLSTRFFEFESALVQVLVGAGGFFLALSFLILAWPKFRREVVEIIRLARLLRRRKSS